MTNDAITAVALARLAAGRSVGPVAPRMKGPSLIAHQDMPSGTRRGDSFHIKWKATYATTPASRGHVRSWFLRTSAPMGLGIFCGPVSGVEIDGIRYGLEVTECDDAETLAKFETLMVEWQYGALLDRLPKELTPRLGAHFPYLTPTIEGNQPLARRRTGVDAKGKDLLQVLIETRGEGGFIVTSPTPPGIHPTVPERGYEMVRGSWEQLPIITAEAREQIFACARALNEYFEEDHTDQESEEQRKTRIGSYASDTPLGDYQARATTASMKVFLECHGYTAVGHIRNDRVYMVRPGKEKKGGHSATLGFAGPGVLHVYSTADGIFQANRSYSPMYLYTYLEHNGDWKAAQKALAAEGYGRPSTATADHASNGTRPATHQQDAGDVVLDDAPLSDQEKPPRPSITLSPEITRIVDTAQQAILTMPGEPRLYQRARRLSVIARAAKSPKWLRRPEGTPVIITPAAAHVREIMAQAATWTKFDKRAKTLHETMPPTWAVDTLVNRVDFAFPPLEGILCAPTIRPDGSLLRTPGYDVDTGLYLALNGTTYPDIPEHPTLDEARSAIGRLQEGIFCDFPFTPVRRGFSAALAALLSLVVRYAIDGAVPLFAVRSTIRGAGKGLLIDGIALTATGTIAPRWAQTHDDDEERKRLMSIALAGDMVSHIDNIVGPLGSGPLDSAITARVIADRTLGVLERQIVPLDTVFFASGNNMAFQGDMARRIIPIDLDPETEHPEDRDDFTHPDLKKSVLENRPALVMAVVTIMRAFFEAECPKQPGIKPLGSFEAWSNLIRQAVIWAGQDDPCDGRHEIEAESDPQYDTLKTLLAAWYGRYGKTPTTIKQLEEDIDGHTAYDKDAGHEVVQPDWRDLHNAVLALDRRGKDVNVLLIGNALKKWKGRMIDGQRFLSTPDTHTKALTWRVESNDALK